MKPEHAAGPLPRTNPPDSVPRYHFTLETRPRSPRSPAPRRLQPTDPASDPPWITHQDACSENIRGKPCRRPHTSARSSHCGGGGGLTLVGA